MDQPQQRVLGPDRMSQTALCSLKIFCKFKLWSYHDESFKPKIKNIFKQLIISIYNCFINIFFLHKVINICMIMTLKALNYN
ncbi:hypothetical protein Hanom_Chr04g00381971 [Helianthus anomalus]